MEREVHLAINRGLNYIARQQNPDGGFTSYSSPVLHPFQEDKHYQTTFVPSLILAALGQQKTAKITGRIADFLVQQKSEHWTYNYWQKGTEQNVTHDYPDDLDDTFCALSALVAYDPAIATEDLLAAAVKVLIATESQPGGPYRTWLVPSDSKEVWLDTDVAVNSNVAYFLSLVSEPLPQLVAFLDTAIVGKKPSSPYYPSSVSILYFLARGYAGHHKEKLATLIKQQLKLAKTELDRALLLTALLRLGEHPVLPTAIRKLLNTQNRDGSWPAAAFCIDPAYEGKTFYHGSAALTTAFVLETLRLYEASRPTKEVVPKESKSYAPAILNLAKQDNQQLGSELRQKLETFLRQVASGTSGAEILGLPHLFNASLTEPAKGQTDFLNQLALGNLYGWTAYTIYDDFLDDEGDPQLLSVANVALRRSLNVFQEVLDPGVVASFFDTIDTANAWELKHCRFAIDQESITIGNLPTFGNLQKLAERSVGHLLGPMAILQRAGYGSNSVQAQKVYQALRHYLIARQLNDDAHDWEEDVQKGCVTFVVVRILQQLKLEPGQQLLKELVPVMKRQFWHQTMAEICEVMQRHIERSRRGLRASGVIAPQSPLLQLLDDLEVSVEATLRTQAQAANFLKYYQQ